MKVLKISMERTTALSQQFWTQFVLLTSHTSMSPALPGLATVWNYLWPLIYGPGHICIKVQQITEPRALIGQTWPFWEILIIPSSAFEAFDIPPRGKWRWWFGVGAATFWMAFLWQCVDLRAGSSPPPNLRYKHNAVLGAEPSEAA